VADDTADRTEPDESDEPAESTEPDAGDEPAESTEPDAGDEPAADDATFAERLENARSLIDDETTACYVGVVREGREVDSTFAQQAGDAQEEGMQALSLLASHLRLVADEANVEYATVAGDAATLAEQLDEEP